MRVFRWLGGAIAQGAYAVPLLARNSFLRIATTCLARSMRLTVLASLALLSTPVATVEVSAHPGGLDAKGCHHNRKTGDYHCHRQRRATRPASGNSVDGSVYFPNCTAARAAGFSNIRRGQAGYRPELDRDDDGIACESN